MPFRTSALYRTLALRRSPGLTLTPSTVSHSEHRSERLALSRAAVGPVCGPPGRQPGSDWPLPAASGGRVPIDSPSVRSPETLVQTETELAPGPPPPPPPPPAAAVHHRRRAPPRRQRHQQSTPTSSVALRPSPREAYPASSGWRTVSCCTGSMNGAVPTYLL